VSPANGENRFGRIAKTVKRNDGKPKSRETGGTSNKFDGSGLSSAKVGPKEQAKNSNNGQKASKGVCRHGKCSPGKPKPHHCKRQGGVRGREKKEVLGGRARKRL